MNPWSNPGGLFSYVLKNFWYLDSELFFEWGDVEPIPKHKDYISIWINICKEEAGEADLNLEQNK